MYDVAGTPRPSNPNVATPQDYKTKVVVVTRGLHGQHGAEAGLAFGHTLIRLGSLGEGVRFGDGLDFSLGDEIERFVKILGTILLAPNHLNSFHQKLHNRQRNR